MALSKLTPAASPAIELFRSFPVGIGIESVAYKECRQSGNVALSHQLDILLKPNGKQMINLDNSTLNMRFRVEDQNGDPVKPAEFAQNETLTKAPTPLSIVNNPIHSFWEGVEFSVNGANVYTSRAHAFSHKNHLKVLRELEFGNTSKQEQGYYLDYPPQLTKNLGIRGGNQGIAQRHKEILNNKSVHVCGPLGLGIAQMKTLLPPETECKLTLIKASDDYILLSAKEGDIREFKIIIEDVWVRLCVVTVTEQVYDGIMATFRKTPAVYMYQESEVKEICFMANNRLPTEVEIVSGLMPYEIVVLFVTQESHQGSKKSNPMALEVSYYISLPSIEIIERILSHNI